LSLYHRKMDDIMMPVASHTACQSLWVITLLHTVAGLFRWALPVSCMSTRDVRTRLWRRVWMSVKPLHERWQLCCYTVRISVCLSSIVPRSSLRLFPAWDFHTPASQSRMLRRLPQKGWQWTVRRKCYLNILLLIVVTIGCCYNGRVFIRPSLAWANPGIYLDVLF